MSTTDVTIRIKGDASSGVAAFDKTGKAAQGTLSAMERIKGASENIRTSVGALTGVIGGLAAASASVAFVNGIRQQIDLADAMDESAQRAGIATSKFSELAYAGKFAGVNSEELVKALNKITQASVAAETGDKSMRSLLVDTLGIRLRNAQGNLTTADEKLMDFVGALGQIEDQNLRTAVAIKLFGDELGPKLLPLVNLSRQGITDLREEARRLGIVISDEAGAAAGDLKDNLEKLKAAGSGVYLQIATELVPKLNELAQAWLTNNKNAGVYLGTLQTIGQAMGFGELMAFHGAGSKKQNLTADLQQAQLDVQRFKEALQMSEGPMGGMRSYLLTGLGLDDVKKQLAEAEAKVAGIKKQLLSLDKPAPKAPAPSAPGSAPGAAPGTGSKDAAIRNALGSQKTEADARAAAAASRQAAAERTRQLNEERQRQRELYEDKVAGLRLELAQWRNNTEEQLRLAEQIAQAAKAQFGAESSEFSAAQQEIVRIRQRAADQQRAIQDEIAANQSQAALASIALEQQQADNAVAMGLMTQRERLALEQGFEDRILEIKRKALEARLELLAKDPDLNPVERQRIYTQIEELERQHKARKGELDGARKAEDNQPLLNTFQSMEAAMADQTTRMIMGQQSAMQTLQGIYAQTATAFVQEMVTKPMAAWLAGEAQKTAATLLGVNTRTAAEATGAAMSTGITAATAIKTIGIKAYEAAASVYASISAIPVIGPFLAPAMAVGALAAVGGFASKIFSAEGGFDIPAGVNPMVQAHAKEMILPAKYADVIRGLAANGGGGGGGSNVQISISALDARSVERWLRGDGGKAIVNELGLRQRSRRF